MNKNSLIVLVVGAALIAGGIYYVSNNEDTLTTETPTYGAAGTVETGTDEEASPAGTGVSVNVNAQLGGVTVTYTDAGFTPATITVKKGTKVTFVNTGSKNMWVAADQHPTHTEYAGTSRTAHCPDTAGVAFDQCSTGNSYTFTFDKIGTWEYHNHVLAGDTGVVVVTQ